MDFSMNDENRVPKNKQKESLPFLTDHIPAAFREKAEVELHETAESRLKCVQELREMIKGEKTLKDIEFHSDFLQQFLRHSKYDVQKAFNRLVNFITSRRNHNSMFNTITDQMFETTKSANLIKCLPWRTPDGSVIIIVKYENWDSNQISLRDFNQYALLILQQCLRDPLTQISGFVFIHDWKNISLRTIRQFTPKILYEGTKAYMDCIPARYKEIHVINHPTSVKIIWAIIKPLMSDKLKRRFVFHSNQKDLLNYIPPSLMPVENGGYLNEESYQSTMSDWLTKALEQQKLRPLGGQCGMNKYCHSNGIEQEDSLPFLFSHIPEAFLKKAEEELNETHENRMEGIREMKNLIESETTLRDIQYHNDLLQMFLRHGKYDPKKAFARFQKYITFKRKYAFIFDAIPDELFEKYESQKFFNILPKRTLDGCVAIILEYGKWNPDEIPWCDFERIPMLICQQSLRDPMTQINGYKIIHDWKGMSFKALRQFTPFNSYQAVHAFYECLPARYKELHVINEPSFFKVIWALVKPLFSEKIKKRIVFHSRPEDLLNHFPRCMIPEKYGGNLKEEDYSNTEWLKNANEQQKQCPMEGQCNYY